MTERHVTAIDLGVRSDHVVLALDPATGVARVLLDRPSKLNAVTLEMRDELAELFRKLERDGRTRVVIIRGAGERAFSAGGEVGMFLQAGPGPLCSLHDNIAAPERFPGPVIAAIDGYCFGVGLELALASDFRIATVRAVFALPEIRLGMIPGSGGTQRLSRLVGLTRAKDMIMRGRRISAEEALAWGLVTQVVEPDQLESAADNLASEMLAMPRLALATAKRVLNLGQETPLAAGLQLEGYAYGMLRGTEDFVEGVQAFVEKREPRFEGR